MTEARTDDTETDGGEWGVARRRGAIGATRAFLQLGLTEAQARAAEGGQEGWSEISAARQVPDLVSPTERVRSAFRFWIISELCEGLLPGLGDARDAGLPGAMRPTRSRDAQPVRGLERSRAAAGGALPGVLSEQSQGQGLRR